jgi:hypothetical protein
VARPQPSCEIAAIAPGAEIIELWNDSPAHVLQAAQAIHEFIKAHSE